MTLTDLGWLSKIFSDMKHCVVSLRQLSFMLNIAPLSGMGAVHISNLTCRFYCISQVLARKDKLPQRKLKTANKLSSLKRGLRTTSQTETAYFYIIKRLYYWGTHWPFCGSVCDFMSVTDACSHASGQSCTAPSRLSTRYVQVRPTVLQYSNRLLEAN